MKKRNVYENENQRIGNENSMKYGETENGWNLYENGESEISMKAEECNENVANQWK